MFGSLGLSREGLLDRRNSFLDRAEIDFAPADSGQRINPAGVRAQADFIFVDSLLAASLSAQHCCLCEMGSGIVRGSGNSPSGEFCRTAHVRRFRLAEKVYYSARQRDRKEALPVNRSWIECQSPFEIADRLSIGASRLRLIHYRAPAKNEV